MRVSLQTVISHGFLCVQNPVSNIAKTGYLAWKETHGLWTPLAPYLDKACPVLISFLFKNQTLQERTHKPMFFLNPSTLTTSLSVSQLPFSLIFSREDRRKNSCCCYSFTTLLWTFLLQHIKLFLLKILRIQALLPKNRWQKEINQVFSPLIKSWG